jgi:hypothetical protein
LIGKSDETVDRRFDLGTIEPDVPQRAVVERAKGCDGGATGEIVRDALATGVEKPKICAGSLRGRRPDDG